mgnify:CR=1 FL=1
MGILLDSVDPLASHRQALTVETEHARRKRAMASAATDHREAKRFGAAADLHERAAAALQLIIFNRGG